MSFLLPLALLIAAFAVFPLLAHALRKGQARPHLFPATALVVSRTTSAKQRHHLEDKLLLLLRILLLCCLALLAASPFVSCSRLSLNRSDGASVAAVLVIDDSASMQALTSKGTTRLEAALNGARQLLGTTRSGDSFAIVLAGHPARILSPMSPDLSSIKDALDAIRPSDRGTDVAGALDLARSLQKDSPQKDRPIVLLSDLAVAETASLDLTDVVLPNPTLREPLENCALVSAVRAPEAVQVEVACTDEDAVRGRKLQIVKKGEPLGSSVDAKDGAVRVPLPKKSGKDALRNLSVRLSPSPSKTDDIAADDECVVIDSGAALVVGVRADQEKAGHRTGTSTLVQAAIEALDRGVRVDALSLVPETARELEKLGALIIDDPSGFSPEARDAIGTFVQRGGVALVLLGPGITQAPLGSDFGPFLASAPTWQKTTSLGASPSEEGPLGPLSTTWADLGSKERAIISDDGVRALARWDDGATLVGERTLGRGILLSVSLPSSVDQSDLALRPAFVELLDYVISQSAIRRGAQATLVGERWGVPPGVTVEGPEGVTLEKHALLGNETLGSYRDYIEPDRAGRYQFIEPGEPSASKTTRVAMRDLREHVTQSSEELSSAGKGPKAEGLAQVEISREIALLALFLGALELGVRARARTRQRGPLQAAGSAP